MPDSNLVTSPLSVGSFDSTLGRPTPLSYDVPQPSSYSGKNCLELDFIPAGGKPEDFFVADLCKQVTPPAIGAALKLDQAELTAKVKADLDLGLGASAILHSNYSVGGKFKVLRTAAPAGGLSEFSVTHSLVSPQGIAAREGVSPDKVAAMLKAGLKMNVYKSMFGTPKVNYIPAVPKIRPRIMLVESHRLSSYLGAYGVGRVLSTMSLLPGEKTRITVRSYTRESTKRAEASSILDSFTQESADDFETAMQSEQSQKDTSAESFEYHAEAEAEGVWGWGRAKVSGGVKGATSSSREEFAKNSSSAVSKHAQKASAKRDIQINSTSEATAEAGQEQEIVREIENINVSRTMTFVFRQMNQEFVTIHHLTDLRLAFFNGDSTRTREYTLPELDDLLNDVIVPAKREDVRKAIEAEIGNILDYRGLAPTACGVDGKPAPAGRAFVEQKSVQNQAGQEQRKYWSFARDLYSIYADDRTNIKSIQGIILNVSKNAMRTDGLIVDTILGGGDGLDAYSHGLQDEKIRRTRLDNDVRQLGIDTVKGGVAVAVAAYGTVFNPPPIVAAKT